MNSLDPELRILLVEDEATDALLMREMIGEWPYEVSLVSVEALADGLARAAAEPFDIVLLDLGLPDSQGLDSFRHFHVAHPKLPVLVLTGNDDTALGIEAMRAGAQDFIVKQHLDHGVLKRAVEHARERHRLNQELEDKTAELVQREERLKLAMIGAQAVLWDEDIVTGGVFFGEGAVNLFRREESAIPDTTAAFFELIHPDDRERISIERERHLDAKTPIEVDFRLRNGTGDYHWVQIRGQPFSRGSGEVHRQVGWIIDITERKESEEALRTFRSYVDQSMDSFEVIDLNTGRYLDVNRQGLEQLGYSREELLQMHVWDVDPDMPEAKYREMIPLVLDQKEIRGEAIHQRKDGSTFPVEFNLRLSDDAVSPRVIASLRDISERLERDEQLLFHKDILEEMGRIAKVGGWLHDYVTGQSYYTDEIALIHEIDEPPTDFDRDYWLSFYDKSSRTTLNAALDNAATNGVPFDLELPLTTPKGTEKWIRVLVQPVMSDGKVIRLRGAFQDVSIRHEEEERRKAWERYFRTLIESSSDAIVVSDREAKTRYVSKGIEANTGYNQDEYLALDILAEVHPADVHRVKRSYLKLIKEQGGSQPIIWRARHKQGHWIWLEGVAMNLLHDPAIRGLVSNFRNVTERITAAQEIESQARMLDAASDAIMLRDLDSMVSYWNEGAERLYGWSTDEACGQDMSLKMSAGDADAVEAQRITLEKGEWAGLLSHRTKTDEVVQVQSRWSLVRGDDGQPGSILEINTDVTDQRELETKFLRAQRLESIGTLAGGIAHDFNNVLSPILMAVELLRGSIQDKNFLNILDILESSAERGKDLVAQVLGFSRGVEGKHMLIKPKHIMREIIHIMEMTFPKSITIKSDISNEVGTILGDATQIDQILMNLCVNARDAMPGGGELKLSLHSQMVDESYIGVRSEITPGTYVVIEVADSGEGISAEVRERIFEPFFTTKVQGSGTGLGLATCASIVKAHRGFIECKSVVGQGATFQVFIPAQLEHQENEDASLAASIPMGNEETILVVDDEISVRKIVEQTLLSFNYKVLTANNGAQGISVYVANRSDIAAVLTDVAMPVMDGPTMIHSLRAIDPQVKILLSTGVDIKSAEIRAAKMDDNYILPKPYVAQTLLTMLRKVLDEDPPLSEN